MSKILTTIVRYNRKDDPDTIDWTMSFNGQWPKVGDSIMLSDLGPEECHATIHEVLWSEGPNGVCTVSLISCHSSIED